MKKALIIIDMQIMPFIWKIHPEIAPAETDPRIVKYHPDMFQDTDLDGILKREGIESLVLCGFQTEYCVDTACRSAYAYGYKTELAMDGHSTFDANGLKAEQIVSHHNETLTVFAEVKPSAEITF